MRTSLKILLLSVFLLFSGLISFAQVMKSFLESQFKIVNSTPLTGKSDFKEVYELMIRQPLDHTDTAKGFFLQRIIVFYMDTALPTVIVTEGYSADYAARSSFKEELTRILNTNQIVIEHRFFSKSLPENVNWDFLTVNNAAADDHDVILLFKKLYKHKWISTGISKGGQTALYHRSIYPDDVDVTVPYVAPLNVALEDGRHEPYINQIGSRADRKAIRDFQFEVLKRRSTLFPKFEKFIAEKHYTFRLPLEEIYDYCVLEYSFAFWQWETTISEIPENDASDDKVFKHFISIASPDYFSLEAIKPLEAFVVEAAKEEGYYGYETEPFKQFLKISTAKNYFQSVFLGPEQKFTYQPSANDKVRQFLAKQDVKMIFLYGEYDPWSATSVVFTDKKQMFKVVKRGGSHATRILNLPNRQQKKVVKQLKKWIKKTT